MRARRIPARGPRRYPPTLPNKHVRHDHVRRPRGRQGVRDLQVRSWNGTRRVRRAGVDPAPSRFAFHVRHHHDADIPASVARRRVARASRPGADRVPSSPPLPNPQVHPQGAVFQVQVRTASSSLVSGERSRSLATAPRRDFGDRWRGGLSGGPRGGHRATRQMRTSTRSQRNGASRDGPHRPRPRRDPRVVPTQPSI